MSKSENFGSKMIGFLVTVAVAGALIVGIETQLASYAANETLFGPVLQGVVPILIGAAVLMYGVKLFRHA